MTATTIRNIETQRRRPGLMLKLLAIPELGLRVADIKLGSMVQLAVNPGAFDFRALAELLAQWIPAPARGQSS